MRTRPRSRKRTLRQLRQPSRVRAGFVVPARPIREEREAVDERHDDRQHRDRAHDHPGVHERRPFALTVALLASAFVALFGFGVPFPIVILAAALVGIPSLRVAGDYYIVASFGLQVVILTVFMNWTDLTNGHAGLVGIPRPRVFGLVIDNPFKYVVLSLALAALTRAVVPV